MSDKWNSYKYVLKRVKKNGLDLRHASLQLRDNEELVLTAIQNNVWALTHASFRLKIMDDIALAAVTRDGNILEYIDRCGWLNTYKNPESIYQAAVNNCPDAIKFIPSTHITRELALIAVRADPKNIQYVTKFTDDYEVVLHCVRSSAKFFYYVKDQLRDNETLALEADYTTDGFYLLSNRLRNNKQIVLRAVSHNWKNVRAAIYGQIENGFIKCQDDFDIALVACKHAECNLDCLSFNMRSNKIIMLTAAKHINISSYIYSSHPLACDGEFLCECAIYASTWKYCHILCRADILFKKLNILVNIIQFSTITSIAVLLFTFKG